MVLYADGTVKAWGSTPGQHVPLRLSSVVAIAAGRDHSPALGDGTVVDWATTRRAEWAGNGRHRRYYGHSLALKADGTVVARASTPGPTERRVD